MTSWIWMKGVSKAVAKPAAPPVTPEDVRPDVNHLITQHITEIVKVKAELQKDKLFDEGKHDDLWILRFVLSHKKKVKAAVAAAKETLVFRDKYKLDDTDIRYEKWNRDSSNPSVRKYMKHMADDGLCMVLPDAKRGVVMYFDMTGFKAEKMLEECSQEDWLGAFIFCNEWTFQWQDYITRTTGRLTKSVRMIDMNTFKMKNMNKEANKRDAHCMTVMEDCYPQNLQSLFICYPPTWIAIPWNFFKLIAPKRVMDKFDMIDPIKKEKDLKKLAKYIDVTNLPKKFGGNSGVWPPENCKLP